MVEIELIPEVNQVLNQIKQGKNFLLSGGAGSGKTYSMVQVINQVFEEYPSAKIACMTYTNAAVREIEERINHKNLNVTTIHDFLWDNIKSFQKELKKSLVALIMDPNSKIKLSDGEADSDYFKILPDEIQYKEWTRIKDGIISHEEVIELSHLMFKTYPRLADILKDKYKFIFVDEYQDTHPWVVEILLIHLRNSYRKNIIGFFGDTMQAIYDDGVGDLKKYLDLGYVFEIRKKQNRRNPLSVINLANRLRTDEIRQEPSTDLTAPNMNNGVIKSGTVKFIYSSSNDINLVKQHLGWDFDDAKQTKELNLTHNLIAPRAGFDKLMEIYDRDPVLALKTDIVAKLNQHKSKGTPLEIDETDSFDKIVDKLALKNSSKILKKDILLEAHKDLYDELKDLPFSIVRNIYIDKDALIDDKKQDSQDESKKGSKRDALIKHLFKIQRTVHLYKQARYNEFFRLVERPIKNIADKKKLKAIIEQLDGMSHRTIEQVIDYADKEGICKKDDGCNNFIEGNSYIFKRVKQVEFEQFQNLFFYLEGYTPFSTQHKIKGTEFNNVLVILDNGKWNNYNFEYLFKNRIDKPSVLTRTQKIFYVCCTRAKENLVVFYHNPDDLIVDKAKQWFGNDNTIKI